jgi:hypothetical protein
LKNVIVLSKIAIIAKYSPRQFLKLGRFEATTKPKG